MAATKITWGRCQDSELRAAHAQCAMLNVPLDYSTPGGTKIRIALSRLRHTVPAAKYQGVLLTNPGGPGVSGLTVPLLLRDQPGHASNAYDVIGFDPRGIGASRPAATCDADNALLYRKTFITTTSAEVAGWVAHTKRYTAACARKNGELLGHMTTEENALDMDSIRRALAVGTISYYGFSYGTYLGEVYATLFPQTIRRMVLDSVVDPAEVWYKSMLSQDVAFKRDVRLWFAHLAITGSITSAAPGRR